MRNPKMMVDEELTEGGLIRSLTGVRRGMLINCRGGCGLGRVEGGLMKSRNGNG